MTEKREVSEVPDVSEATPRVVGGVRLGTGDATVFWQTCFGHGSIATGSYPAVRGGGSALEAI